MSLDPRSWSPLTWAKKRFVDGYVRHLQRRASNKRDKIREIQLESGRTKEQTIRVDVFELDVTQRGIVDQALFSYFVKVREGEAEILTKAERWDVRVFTDVPTLIGFAKGEIDRVFPDGRRRKIRPFKPMDALRMGTLETDGSGTALSNLMLLERTVFPELAKELRFADPEAAAA